MKEKTVTFQKRVKVVYFEQTPVEMNVCWMQIARDRMRFRRRILEVERRIGWVFTKSHRERIFKTLYSL